MTKFEWQTEEDVNWDELPQEVEVEEPPRRRQRLVFVLVALLVLGLAGLVVYREGERRVQTAVANTKEDILASHRLIHQANAQGDLELFRTLLSGRDDRWSAVQKQLVEDSLLYDRTFFSLRAQPLPAALRLVDEDDAAAGEAGTVEITVSPDLTSAELHFMQPYVFHQGDSLTQTITLQQTAVYRRGEQHWLFSPPAPEFWGQRYRANGEFISLSYRQRDQEFAERLLFDLDAALDKMCRTLDGIDCPSDLAVHLRLEHDASTLPVVTRADATVTGALRLALPTPTLVGEPVDEAGYEVLSRGYRAHIVAAVITHIVGEPQNQELPYRALLDKQLHQLELRPWPLTPARYEQIVRDDFRPEQVLNYWNQPADAAPKAGRLLVYALVDFLLEEWRPELMPVTMQRRMSGAQAFSYFAGSEQPRPFFFREWLRFVARKTASARLDAPPVPLPAHDIQVACSETDGRVAFLNRYHLDAGVWSSDYVVEMAGDGSVYMESWPDGEGFFRYEAPGGEESWRTVLHHNGKEVVLATAATMPRFLRFNDVVDPTGRYLGMRTWNGSERRAHYHLLDLQSCSTEACDLQRLPGQPTWSPDGSQMLTAPVIALETFPYQRWQMVPLHRAQTGERSFVKLAEDGSRPFWLTNERFGYVRLGQEQELEVVTAVVGDDTPRLLFSTADLLAILPDSKWPPQLFILDIIRHPTDARQLAVVAASSLRRAQAYYLYSVELADDYQRVENISLRLPAATAIQAAFSPDGRWLAAFGTTSFDNNIYLFNLQDGQEQTIESGFSQGFLPLWSPGGRWLLQNREGYMLLFAPGHDYQRVIVHDFELCHDVTWAGER